MSDGCDFCLHTQPGVVRYVCDDFAVTAAGPYKVRSTGDWFACAVCKALLEKQDFRALSRRALVNHPLYRDLKEIGADVEVREQIENWHRLFYARWVKLGRRVAGEGGL